MRARSAPNWHHPFGIAPLFDPTIGKTEQRGRDRCGRPTRLRFCRRQGTPLPLR
jgi:hypothetical protein